MGTDNISLMEQKMAEVNDSCLRFFYITAMLVLNFLQELWGVGLAMGNYDAVSKILHFRSFKIS